MKRTELIEILKSKIKTLNCADFDELKDDLLTDEEGNPIHDSILVSETKIRPWKISENYGVGIEGEYRGEKYISKKDDDEGFKRCGISITDFSAYGNYHCYAEINVKHASWKNIKTGSNLLSTELSDRFPEVEYIISWNANRVLFEDDLTNGKGDWHGYEANETTERFDLDSKYENVPLKKFKVVPDFNGFGNDNKLKIQGATGAQGTDPELVDLIMKYVRMPVVLQNETVVPTKGILQGAPLSNLLCNIYLSVLDRYLEKQDIQKKPKEHLSPARRKMIWS